MIPSSFPCNFSFKKSWILFWISSHLSLSRLIDHFKKFKNLLFYPNNMKSKFKKLLLLAIIFSIIKDVLSKSKSWLWILLIIYNKYPDLIKLMERFFIFGLKLSKLNIKHSTLSECKWALLELGLTSIKILKKHNKI